MAGPPSELIMFGKYTNQSLKFFLSIKNNIGTKMKASTNALLDLCRFGIGTKNEKADTAARELSSYIVFHSLMEETSTIPKELYDRIKLLQQAVQNPADFPQDIFEEEDAETGPSDETPSAA
jgi:hypothetical protein